MPKQNDGIFEVVFVYFDSNLNNVCSQWSNEKSPAFVWLGTGQATSHYLNEWKPILTTHICITRLQLVNTFKDNAASADCLIPFGERASPGSAKTKSGSRIWRVYDIKRFTCLWHQWYSRRRTSSWKPNARPRWGFDRAKWNKQVLLNVILVGAAVNRNVDPRAFCFALTVRIETSWRMRSINRTQGLI